MVQPEQKLQLSRSAHQVCDRGQNNPGAAGLRQQSIWWHARWTHRQEQIVHFWRLRVHHSAWRGNSDSPDSAYGKWFSDVAIDGRELCGIEYLGELPGCTGRESYGNDLRALPWRDARGSDHRHAEHTCWRPDDH